MPDPRKVLDNLDVGLPKTLSKGLPKTLRYSRIPENVLFDKTIDQNAKAVYAALAFECFQGRTASIGTRLIASRLGMSRTGVKSALWQLVDAGHITRAKQRIRRSSVYMLNSGVFGAKQGQKTEILSSPRSKRMVSSGPA